MGANYLSQEFALFGGNGKSTLENIVNSTTFAEALKDIATTNFNGDGHLDVVVFCRFNEPLTMILVNGDDFLGATIA